MQSDIVKCVRRRIKLGTIEAHPSEKALVVNYELEATLVGELGDRMMEETKECQKIIRVKSLNEATDVATLAQEIVDRCSLIPSSKVHDVAQILYYLKTRKDAPYKHEYVKKRAEGHGKAEKEREGLESTQIDEIANINSLESYIELLYEDIPEKIRASALVLQLSRNPDNLRELAANEILLGALTRVLREDGRKSIDLSTNIIYIFFCFSTFSQFHHVIAQYKIGSHCMEVIEHELKRHEQWKDEITRKKNIIELDREDGTLRRDYEKSLKKYKTLVKKQDQLLRVSFYLLLNIAEDPKVELKMVNRGIVPILIKCLERDLPELLVLVVSFLKKLSIFVENKNEMAQHNVVEKIARLIPCEHADLQLVTLRFLQNLSFDLELRNAMVKIGLVPKLVMLMTKEASRSAVLPTLYHISMDDRCKSLFTYTDCIPTLMKLIFECKEEKVPMEVMALAINLAINKRNAQLMCDNHGLKMLMRRALHFEDSLIMKMIRNIAQHDGPTKNLFLDFLSNLAQVVQSSANEDFVLECLGVLSNLTIPGLDFERLLKQFGLLEWLKNHLVAGVYEDDLVLEAIVFVGTASLNESSALLLAKSGILKNLIDLLNEKQEDDEIVLQIIYAFHNMIKHPKTRELLVRDTQVPAYLIDLMHDKNVEIRKLCDATLDIIAEYDQEWAKKILLEKFCWYNSQWLETIQSQQFEDSCEIYIEDSLGHFVHETESLHQQELFNGGILDSPLDYSISPVFHEDDHSSSRSSSSSAHRPASAYAKRYSSDLDLFMDCRRGSHTERYSTTGYVSSGAKNRPASIAFVNGVYEE